MFNDLISMYLLGIIFREDTFSWKFNFLLMPVGSRIWSLHIHCSLRSSWDLIPDWRIQTFSPFSWSLWKCSASSQLSDPGSFCRIDVFQTDLPKTFQCAQRIEDRISCSGLRKQHFLFCNYHHLSAWSRLRDGCQSQTKIVCTFFLAFWRSFRRSIRSIFPTSLRAVLCILCIKLYFWNQRQILRRLVYNIAYFENLQKILKLAGGQIQWLPATRKVTPKTNQKKISVIFMLGSNHLWIL